MPGRDRFSQFGYASNPICPLRASRIGKSSPLARTLRLRIRSMAGESSPACVPKDRRFVVRQKVRKWPAWLSGHSQQIDDLGFVFERPRIGPYEAMIDRNLADLIEFVFTDPDVCQAAR